MIDLRCLFDVRTGTGIFEWPMCKSNFEWMKFDVPVHVPVLKVRQREESRPARSCDDATKQQPIQKEQSLASLHNASLNHMADLPSQLARLDQPALLA